MPSSGVSGRQKRVGVVGLGSMGLGIAQSLHRAGFAVSGYDVTEAAVQRFVDSGGRGAKALADVARDMDAVVSVVVNAAQTETVLFGDTGIAGLMPKGSAFISCATMDPAAARDLGRRVEEAGLLYVDAPISGGAQRAAEGALTVLTSGSQAALAHADPVLKAMAANIYELGDSAGTGSAFKMINQLLAGVHIAAACEAVAFAERQGLDIRKVYEVITASAGNSWMFENRVPHILEGDYRPRSATNIFVKDLGIILDMARANKFPVPIAGAALQSFLMTAAAGMGMDDDASVARMYALMTGGNLPGMERKPSR